MGGSGAGESTDASGEVLRKAETGGRDRYATTRRRLRLALSQIGRPAELARLPFYPGGTALHVGAGPVDAQAPRIRQHRREQGRLARGQRAGGLAEIRVARRCGAVDAVAEFGHVQIDLEDA